MRRWAGPTCRISERPRHCPSHTNKRYDCEITRVVGVFARTESHIAGLFQWGVSAEWCEGGCIAPVVGTGTGGDCGGVSPAGRADYQWSGAVRGWRGARVPLSPAVARPRRLAATPPEVKFGANRNWRWAPVINVRRGNWGPAALSMLRFNCCPKHERFNWQW